MAFIAKIFATKSATEWHLLAHFNWFTFISAGAFNPVYDKRTQSCVKSTVVQKSNEITGN